MRKTPGPCTVHKCRKCGTNARVVDTRSNMQAYIKRIMRCNNAMCSERWTTYEIRESDYHSLVKARNQLAGIQDIAGLPLRDGVATKTHRGRGVLSRSEHG